MTKKANAFDEIEKILQDIGSKIELLIEKGADASVELRDDVEEKIQQLRDEKEKLEKEFENKKNHFEEKYKDKKEEMEPKFRESINHFKDAFQSLANAINALMK
jgi:Skp family chaperone for outer membrane proteins